METIPLMIDIDRRYRAISQLPITRYKIFYSRIDPADVLVLGINPGGDPTAWDEEVTKFYPKGWVKSLLANDFWFENFEHEYVDCSYPIQQVMLRFLMNVLRTDEEGVRRVPKTNLVFRRSPGTDAFKMIQEMSLTEGFRESQPFVTEIIQQVKPKTILLEGMTLLDIFRRGFCSRGFGDELGESIKVLHRGNYVRIFAAHEMYVDCLDRIIRVVAVGHPSNFGARAEFNQVEEAVKSLVQGKPVAARPIDPVQVPRRVVPKERARKIVRQPADTTANLNYDTAASIGEDLIAKLRREGHAADLKLSKTRVSIKVRGYQKQVIGIVPGKRSEISCPGFSEALVRGYGAFREWRGYNIVTLATDDPIKVTDICVRGLQKGNLLS